MRNAHETVEMGAVVVRQAGIEGRSVEPVRIGCSGWPSRDRRAGLCKGVPQRRRPERDAEELDTVEVNAPG